jgi:hypothetical protein
MARVYHRDQAGAPALVFSTGTGHANHWASLKAIIKGALVSGYGSVPGAGWELIAEGANYLVLRNGSHSGYICFTYDTRASATSGRVEVWLAETFTGMSGDWMTGDGLRSGVAANNGVPHTLGLSYAFYASAVVSWVIIADEKSAVLSISTSTSTTVPNDGIASLPSESRPVLLAFGEDTEGIFLALGGENTAPGVLGPSIRNYFAVNGFTTLRDPKTNLLVGSSALGAGTPGLSTRNASHTAITLIKAVDQVRVSWAGAVSGEHAQGGYIRGVTIPGLLHAHVCGAVAGSLGHTSYNSRSIHVPVQLAGSDYYAAFQSQASVAILLSANPVLWA